MDFGAESVPALHAWDIYCDSYRKICIVLDAFDKGVTHKIDSDIVRTLLEIVHIPRDVGYGCRGSPFEITVFENFNQFKQTVTLAIVHFFLGARCGHNFQSFFSDVIKI